MLPEFEKCSQFIFVCDPAGDCLQFDCLKCDPDSDPGLVGNALPGYSIHLFLLEQAGGGKWMKMRITLPNGDVIWICIELLFGAVFINSPTPLRPNTVLEIGEHLTGDCLIILSTIITSMIIVSCR